MPASTQPLTNHQALTNHQVRLAARPSGLPRATDWSLTTEEVPDPAGGSSWWRSRTCRSTRPCGAG